MITVVIDTTATFVDPMMRRTRWLQLLTLCNDSMIELVVPEIVVRETARHWAREAQQALDTANERVDRIAKSRSRMRELGLDSSELPRAQKVDVKVDVAEFESSMRDRLTALGVDVRPVPNHLSLEDVLERDLAQMKPFDKSGRGFRDALVWETVKEVVLSSDAGTTIYFVTDNSADFCGTDGSLSSELQEELGDADVSVVRTKNLDDLLSETELGSFVDGLIESDEELSLFMTAPRTAGQGEPLSVHQVITNAVFDALDRLTGTDIGTDDVTSSDNDFVELGVPPGIEEPSISYVSGNEASLTWQTYETYQDTTRLIQAELDVEVDIEGFAIKSDALFLSEENAADILEWDWNDHVARVGVTVPAHFEFQIRLEQGMDFVEECVLEGISPVDQA